jgi:hypothetical protein
MGSLNDIVEEVKLKEKKPRMDKCRVFRVDVENAAPCYVQEIMNIVRSDMEKKFDISHVIFVPVRGIPTGWQFPQEFAVNTEKNQINQ